MKSQSSVVVSATKNCSAAVLKLLAISVLATVSTLMAPIGTVWPSFWNASTTEKIPLTIDRVECASFDPSEIKIITFDVFAALMDLVPSLEKGFAQAAPGLTVDEAKALANDSMNGYGSYMYKSFTHKQTGGLEPFQFVIQSTLEASIIERGLSTLIPSGSEEFRRVVEAWANLVPRENTKSALAKLQSRYLLAPLSNGDKWTLATAMQVLKPEVHMSKFIFSSDWPVGAFKPLAPIYSQVLEQTGLSARQVLHVAGSSFDAAGAREYGLYSALLYGKSDPGPYKACFDLEDISHLPVLLGVH